MNADPASATGRPFLRRRRAVLQGTARRPHDESHRRPVADAGSSVAANYHAACRARSRAEFISKLCTTVEEADESVLWLGTLKRTALAEGPELDRLYQEASELLAIFAASRHTATKRRRRDDGSQANPK